MSYDLQVWSAVAVDLAKALPTAAEWRIEADVSVWGGRGWQVVVGPQHRVDPDDVPEDVHAALPGVQQMTELNLEPIDAPSSAYALLRRIAKAVASASHGVILDLQTGTLTTARGVRRFAPTARNRVTDALVLSWFSVSDVLRSREWLDQFVGYLERRLPEALPVRYGPYEPPSHRLLETGRVHLIDLLAEEYLDDSKPGLMVWSPKRPVLNVALSLSAGPCRLGWRAHRVTVAVEAAVLQQPGWPTALCQVWRDVAHLARAFYSDVRTLRSQRLTAATTEEWLSADRHPVCAAFWAGVPADGGHAVSLGEPYLREWPAFELAGTREEDIVFLIASDWSQPGNVFEQIGGVPERLAAQSSGYAPAGLGPNLDRVYPPAWPFGPTHLDRRLT